MKWNFLLVFLSIILFTNLPLLCYADSTTMRWRTGESNPKRIVFKISDYDTILKFSEDISLSQIGWHSDKLNFYSVTMGSGPTVTTFTISLIQGNLSITNLLENDDLEATGSASSGSLVEFYVQVTYLGQPTTVEINGASTSGTSRYADYTASSSDAWCHNEDKVYLKGVASSDVQFKIDWTPASGDGTSPPPPSPSGEGGLWIPPGIFVTAETIDLGPIQQGTTKNFNTTLTWSGSTTISLAGVKFDGEGTEWLKKQLTTPQTYTRPATETKGIIHVPLTIKLPLQAKLGRYRTIIQYDISPPASTRTYQLTANILWTVTATPIAPTDITQLMTILLLIALVGIIVISIKKH